jgi:sphingomyelin phosphodiesterase 2
MKILLKRANILDAWANTHPPPPASPVGNAQEAMETFGLTVDTPLNTWSSGKPLDNFARRWLGKRLDYILYRSPRPDHSSLTISSTKIVLTENVPGHAFSYSDHFGLEATFLVHSAGADPGHVSGSVGVDTTNLIVENSNRLSDGELLTALGALAFELHEAKARANRNLGYFCSCVGVLTLILIGSAWITMDSRWVAPVATFLGAVTTWWGTTSLYVGVIYGRKEKGILDNLMEEVDDEIRHNVPTAAAHERDM